MASKMRRVGIGVAKVQGSGTEYQGTAQRKGKLNSIALSLKWSFHILKVFSIVLELPI
jgi:hypothetical protein